MVGATKAACQTNLDALIAVLNEVGFAVAPEKVVQPTQLCPWLGFVIDLSTSRVVVSKARFARLRAEARWCLEHASRCPTARLATIAGRLSHAAQAVVGSRAFLVALHSMAAVDRPVVSLSAAARDDLSWWMTESIDHNGVRAWMRGGSPHPGLPFLSFFSDASGVDGFGAHTASECVVGSYGDAARQFPIANCGLCSACCSTSSAPKRLLLCRPRVTWCRVAASWWPLRTPPATVSASTLAELREPAHPRSS